MSDKRVLAARAYRDGGKWWTVEIPELTSPGPGGTTITASALGISRQRAAQLAAEPTRSRAAGRSAS